MMDKLLCFLGCHFWQTIFSENPREVRKCKICGKIQSSVYDMSTGETYFVNGNIWLKEAE